MSVNRSGMYMGSFSITLARKKSLSSFLWSEDRFFQISKDNRNKKLSHQQTVPLQYRFHTLYNILMKYANSQGRKGYLFYPVCSLCSWSPYVPTRINDCRYGSKKANQANTSVTQQTDDCHDQGNGLANTRSTDYSTPSDIQRYCFRR